MNYYFGEDWGAPVTEGATRVATPVFRTCALCREAIGIYDAGTFIGVIAEDAISGERTSVQEPVHKECSLREVLGGIGHNLDHDTWCTEYHDPDAGLGLRQSALLLWSWIGAR